MGDVDMEYGRKYVRRCNILCKMEELGVLLHAMECRDGDVAYTACFAVKMLYDDVVHTAYEERGISDVLFGGDGVYGVCERIPALDYRYECMVMRSVMYRDVFVGCDESEHRRMEAYCHRNIVGDWVKNAASVVGELSAKVRGCMFDVRVESLGL